MRTGVGGSVIDTDERRHSLASTLRTGGVRRDRQSKRGTKCREACACQWDFRWCWFVGCAAGEARAGCEVVGTCEPDNVEFVKSCGAVEAVNYHTTSLKSWLEEDESRIFSVMIDCVEKPSREDAWWAIKDNGTLISTCQLPEQLKPKELEK
jgi:hypothetical protein